MSQETSFDHFYIGRWTKGEAVERSARKQVDSQQPHFGHQVPHNQETLGGLDDARFVDSPMFTKQLEGGIGGGGYTTMLDQQFQEGFTRQQNKREAFNEKLSHRDLHAQVGQNPFLAGEHYLNHLQIQESFLRPQNTNVISPNTNG